MLRPGTLAQWPTIKGLILVEREREDYGQFTGKASLQRCFYITSLPKTTAADLTGYIRGHGAENYSRLNRIALNLRKNDHTVKASIRCKRIKATSDRDYRLRLICT